MAAGLALGRLVPGLAGALSAVRADGVSLPIAIGLLNDSVMRAADLTAHGLAQAFEETELKDATQSVEEDREPAGKAQGS